MKRDELTVGGEYAFIPDRYDAPRRDEFPLRLARVKLVSVSEPIVIDRSRGNGAPDLRDTGRQGYKVEFVAEWRGGWRGTKNPGDTMIFEKDSKGSKKFWMGWEEYAEARQRYEEQVAARDGRLAARQAEQDAGEREWNATMRELGLDKRFDAFMAARRTEDGQLRSAQITLSIASAGELLDAVRRHAAQGGEN